MAHICMHFMSMLLQPVSGSEMESKDAEAKLNLYESEVQEAVENAPPPAESETATATLETTAPVN